VNRNAALCDARQGLCNLSAPCFAISQDHEDGRIARSTAKLFVLFDNSQAPRNSQFQVGVPGRVIFQPKRWLRVKMIKEEEQRVGIAREPYLGCRNVGEDRHRNPVLPPAQGVAQLTEKLHRALPPITNGLTTGAVGHRHITDAHRR
jgi:hypothetical protein